MEPQALKFGNQAPDGEYLDGDGCVYVVEAYKPMIWGHGHGWCILSVHLTAENLRKQMRRYRRSCKYEYLRARVIDASIAANRNVMFTKHGDHDIITPLSAVA